MGIQQARIESDLRAIARCTATPGEGATRPTFSQPWAAARRYVIAQAETAGCEVRTDAAGNVHARPGRLGWDAAAWLCGSHIDTVPHGGDFDGVAGVVVALELLRSAADDSIEALPLELIVFAEEEGPTFGLGMIGARLWAKEISRDQLQTLKNAQGQSYLEAGASFGVEPSRLSDLRLDRGRIRGLIEVHIEQGPGMWRRDERLAIVRAIAGRRQYAATIRGEANHAGATAMSDRKDALAATAAIAVELERIARGISADAVLTVGRLTNHPNAINVIPDRVDFTIDFRAGDDQTLTGGDAAIRSIFQKICGDRGVEFSLQQTESIVATPMDAALQKRLGRAAVSAGYGSLPMTVSGALHDTAVLGRYVPAVMLFVPSRDGISHNPAEFSRMEDVAAAANVVQEVVRRPTLAQLEGLDRSSFARLLGGIFEHSPWVAERAWEARPFSSLGDLHEKMCRVVATASTEEQLALVRAHPDLIGRLAGQGRLTRESASEQAAAGLDALSAQEIAAFEDFNAKYRQRFGFPFVICARQNRKDAILAAFPRRLLNSPEQELANAVSEIDKIARLRLADAVWED